MLDARRKRIVFRSWHRGMREVDLILGRFADNEISTLTEEEIDQYERLLEIPDTVLLPWLTGESIAPADQRSGILLRVLAFRQATHFRS